MIESEVPNNIKIKAKDSVMDETGSFKITSVKKIKFDEGLPHELKVGISAQVMLTRNQNVQDGIVNGMLGHVTGFTKNEKKEVDIIWVQPDDKNAGKVKRKELKREFQINFPSSIPIKRVEANLEVAKTSSFKRRQFPLKLCYAATIHKYQGRSLDVVVISGFKERFWTGL
jgi:ATP-dependent exoDNAse (exonuclease V) alpha subunit